MPTEKDVNRTDRSMPFYGGEDNPNVVLLHNVLMTYVMYNFDLGYVQGMSDLLAPILYVVQHESTAFWCFVGYLDMVVRAGEGWVGYGRVVTMVVRVRVGWERVRLDRVRVL